MIFGRDHGRVIRRHELSNAEGAFVQPLLPRPERGRRRLDDRTVLNGIVWKFRTGSAWRDVPERYGSWATLHTCFRRWAKDGTFERMRRAAQARADATGDIEWLVSVDSTIVRVHQHAAGARKGGFAPQDSAGPERPDQQDPPGLRRSGPTARLHRHRREHQRLHPVHGRDGGDAGARPGPGGPGCDPTTSSPTRAAAPKPYAPGSGGATSGTRRPAQCRRDALAGLGAHPAVAVARHACRRQAGAEGAAALGAAGRRGGSCASGGCGLSGHDDARSTG
ncbi:MULTISPECIES: IS5 family transposase [Streptomyces]|uniref:IS5 family transposase n=1 Tax=Streptomyces TaxID=1883 RepID=UPI000AA1408F